MADPWTKTGGAAYPTEASLDTTKLAPDMHHALFDTKSVFSCPKDGAPLEIAKKSK